MREKRERTEYSHYEQTGERIRVLHTDGTWDMCDDVNKTKGNLPLWLIHHCSVDGTDVDVQRYEGILVAPCSFCGERCPIALEGLFNMVMHL